MHIFIDESGSFTRSKAGKNDISCIGALTIPDKKIDAIISNFNLLKSKWPNVDGETKGRILGESEISNVIKMLEKHDVIFNIIFVDMSLNSDEDITKHRLKQAYKLTENLTSHHHDNIIKHFWELRKILEGMPNQLYVQYIITTDLLVDIIEVTTLYYCQRRPKELAKFSWLVDAKDKNRTEYEKWWTMVVLGFMQSKSSRQSFIQMKEGCYKYFERYFYTLDKTPDYLIPQFGLKAPFDVLDINLLMQEDFAFVNSKDNLGLQLVDILTNAFRRALKNNLQKTGWANLGRLMLRRANRTIHFTAFADKPRRIMLDYTRTLNEIERCARPILLDKYYNQRNLGSRNLG